jgi:hypothetical protein
MMRSISASGMSDPDMLEIVEREWGRALPASYTGFR